MIKFEFNEHSDLKQEVIDSLWNQGVDMDDWDYMIFAPASYRKHFRETEEGEYTRGNLFPNSYNVERLLTGCCHNAWYEVTDFKGKHGVLGVAYHA